MDLKAIKNEVYHALVADLNQRIETLQSEFKVYSESAANETKSTAGDKHDTSKSMMQLEQEKLSSQLNQLKEQKKHLSFVDINEDSDKIKFGSLVQTDKGLFFISISTRPITVNLEQVQCISIGSPIGQLMKDKQKNDQINFMGKNYLIQHIG